MTTSETGGRGGGTVAPATDASPPDPMATPPIGLSLAPLDPPERSRRRRWSLRRWLFVVGALTAVYAILAIASGSYALSRLTDARAAVLNEVQPALTAVDDLSTALVDQETGVNGYLLVGRDEFLQPYDNGKRREQEAAAALRELARPGDIPGLERDLDAVLAAAEDWRAGYAEPAVATVRENGPETGGVSAATGKLRFDTVRTRITALDVTVRNAREAATLRLQDVAAFLQVVFIGIAGGLAVLIVIVGVWLRRAVTSPVSNLASEVREVVSGDAHRQITSDGPEEIASLAADVEAMRRHIIAELDALAIAHRRLDEQTRDLERSNRDLEQFAYVASHDLQEPLRKVSSFCQLLQRRYGGQLDERADSYIAFAVDGASRMQALINDLLAFSRVGRMTSGFADIDLAEAVTAAVGQLSTAAEEAGAEVHVGELPMVRGETPLLTLLITNLIGNAIKFRRPGVPPEITIEAAPAEPDVDGGAMWEIAVADNGIGVEPEYADKVFVIFQRLHARDDYPGTGIGLAMAKKIVEYHGGRIWIDPERTDGATVRFTLPAGTDTEPGTEPDAPSTAQSTEEPASW